jgi:NAD(P)-dependent dehydrogenase (short-subunit alcohol dehydrogenase family)
VGSATGQSLSGRTVLVTGANRGLGRALVEEALARGAERVYAATRQPLTHPDRRVVPVTLDVTDAGQLAAVVNQIEHLDLLINNAGHGSYETLDDRASVERHLRVNLFGTYDVTHALLPLLTASGGAVVNVLSVAGLAALPVMPAYSISKAAALSMSQSLRALLAAQGVTVHVVLAGPVDTDMVRDLDLPKTAPELVARGILDGVASGTDDIFPDPMSASLAAGWRSSTSKALESEFAVFVAPAPVAS